MCKPSPGPRCSGHAKEQVAAAKERLAEAEAAFDKAPTQATDVARTEAAAKLEEAKKNYLATPKGIKALRKAGKNEAADYYEGVRESQTAAWKEVEPTRALEKSIAHLPDGGSDALHNRRTPLSAEPTCKEETVAYWELQGYYGRKHCDDWENPKVIDSVVRAEFNTENVDRTYQNANLRYADVKTLEFMRDNELLGDDPTDYFRQQLDKNLAKRYEDAPKKNSGYWVGTSPAALCDAAENETDPAVLAAIADYETEDVYVHARLADNSEISRETALKLYERYEELSERKNGLEGVEELTFDRLSHVLRYKQ